MAITILFPFPSLQIALYSIELQFDKLIEKKQAHT